MDPIVIATGNPHKVEELRAIFGDVGVPIVGLSDLPDAGRFREPEEHGRTFEENATIKAISYASQTGRLCVADDSGLEVDALGGAPGVISSHFSTDGMETGMERSRRDLENNRRLLLELEHVDDEARRARFVCVMVLAGPRQRIDRSTERDSRDGRGGAVSVIAMTRGTFEGRIGRSPDVPRGTNGFGYDPLFLLPSPDDRTSAELSPIEKNARSHRGEAARKMAETFRAMSGRHCASDGHESSTA